MLQCYKTTIQIIPHISTVRNIANIFRESFQVYNDVSSPAMWAMQRGSDIRQVGRQHQEVSSLWKGTPGSYAACHSELGVSS